MKVSTLLFRPFHPFRWCRALMAAVTVLAIGSAITPLSAAAPITFTVRSTAPATTGLTLDQIRAHLVQWEGYRTQPYRDGPGWSVGIGHSLTQHGEQGIWHRPYTSVEIERLFRRDVAWSLDACRQGIEDFDALPIDVQLVAIGVCWGVGRTGFERFRGFRLALSYRAYDSAATELRLSRWAGQVGPNRTRAYVQTLRQAYP